MNKQEIAYMKRQLENELQFYNKALELLEKIEISQVNKRAEKVINAIIQNKDIVELKLEGFK